MKQLTKEEKDKRWRMEARLLVVTLIVSFIGTPDSLWIAFPLALWAGIYAYWNWKDKKMENE